MRPSLVPILRNRGFSTLLQVFTPVPPPPTAQTQQQHPPPPPPRPRMTHPVHLKITFFPSEEVRRHTIDLNAPPTLAQMRDTLLAHVLPADRRFAFVFKYCDDEGDYVTIGSEEEWHDALLYNQQRLLRIQIVDPSGGPAPPRQATAPNQPRAQPHHHETDASGFGEGIATLISQIIGGSPPNFMNCPHFAQFHRQWQQQQQEAGQTGSEASSSCPPPQPSSSTADGAGSQPQQQQTPAGFDEFFRQNPQFQPYAQMAMQFLQRLQASGGCSSSCPSSAASTAADGSSSSSSSSGVFPIPNLEQLMRGIFHQPQQPPEPAQQTREQQLATLHELGYLDDETNSILLERFHGNVERVVQEYIQFTSGH